MPRDMKMAAVPVYLDGKPEQVVGRAVVDTDGDIVMMVNGDIMIRDIPNLVELGQIKGLLLGVQYNLPASPEATGA